MSAIPETTGEDREDQGDADPEYYEEQEPAEYSGAYAGEEPEADGEEPVAEGEEQEAECEEVEAEDEEWTRNTIQPHAADQAQYAEED